MPDGFEIRICNALTILRSIAGYNEIAINLASSHLLYFMCPLIETNNPRFSNIRKVGIAVFVEVTSGNKDPFIYQTFVDDGILNVCLNVIERVDLKEKGGIMLMLNNILCFDMSFCEKLNNVLLDKIYNALVIYENEIKKSPQETAKLKDCIENIRRCIHANEYNGYAA
ncbi:uncharacterized protein [Blastocystis hominis]|uniref:Uncharacterized protein n=1 Tax=Blastocystis hominis TaxID=12968 RepID=D8M5G0_BLAHO|nr:uncharacterized protein [Blastocystis hominis]CBK23299.2 unnamed protein product [Blastocystis hominis]|eukprot:XP_012897347.1 uncharacterized protein [Blastocystis hominis]